MARGVGETNVLVLELAVRDIWGGSSTGAIMFAVAWGGPHISLLMAETESAAGTENMPGDVAFPRLELWRRFSQMPRAARVPKPRARMIIINTHCQWPANLTIPSDQHHSMLAEHSVLEVWSPTILVARMSSPEHLLSPGPQLSLSLSLCSIRSWRTWRLSPRFLLKHSNCCTTAVRAGGRTPRCNQRCRGYRG
jgi:hypothetical protein